MVVFRIAELIGWCLFLLCVEVRQGKLTSRSVIYLFFNGFLQFIAEPQSVDDVGFRGESPAVAKLHFSLIDCSFQYWKSFCLAISLVFPLLTLPSLQLQLTTIAPSSHNEWLQGCSTCFWRDHYKLRILIQYTIMRFSTTSQAPACGPVTPLGSLRALLTLEALGFEFHTERTSGRLHATAPLKKEKGRERAQSPLHLKVISIYDNVRSKSGLKLP